MTWLWLAIAVGLDGAVALAGGVLPDAWLARHRTTLIAFATGTLLTAALVDILPAAIDARGTNALWWATGGFVAIAVGEATIGHERATVSPGSLLLADALHNLADGMAIAAAFVVSVPLGVMTALAVIVHELPEELGDYALLRAAGMDRNRSLLALFIVQCTSALGAAGTFDAAQATASLAGIALAIAGGTFLYIATVDLLPHVLRARAFAGLAAGILMIAIQAAV